MDVQRTEEAAAWRRRLRQLSSLARERGRSQLGILGGTHFWKLLW
jgi:hypothetical protein